MFGTEDDDDFTPVASSKLASLFEKSSDPGNKSLTYTAPKQPKKVQTGSSSTASSQHGVQPAKLNVIIVKVVQTFRLEDGNYNPQGKLGAAVLGCPTSRIFQLLLYKSKQQQITTTKITDSFKFTVQPNNYASFYDDQRQNWSILFDSEQDVLEFAREIGLACASSYRDQDAQPFYFQDLKFGSGLAAELGDLVEVRYSTSLLVNSSIGQEIENNLKAEKPQRVKIRKGVWEEALLGVAKNGKRLIILASVLFGPWKPQALPDSRLVVEVEIVRIKSAKRSRDPTPSGLKHLAESSESNVDSSTDETSIKARGASISEALTNSPKTHKASIISRMARMGQATLPLKGAVVCNPSDSEETEEEGGGLSGGSSSGVSKPVAKTRTSTMKPRSSRPSIPQEPPASTAAVPTVASSPIAQQVAVFSSPGIMWEQTPQHSSQPPPPPHMVNGVPFSVSPQYNHFTTSNGQIYPALSVPPVTQHQLLSASTGAVTPPDSHIAVFMSENRAQSTELRMGMNKIIDKVDQVMMKVDSLQQQQQLQQQQRALGQSSVGTLELPVLLSGIQKLVNDYELLQTELADKRFKLEQQNEKMYHLLHANQKFMEQSSSMMEQRQDSSLQTTIFTLQQEKERLSEELKKAISKTHSLQEEADKYRSNNDFKEEVKSVTAELHKHQAELESCQHTILELEKKLLKSEDDLVKTLQVQHDQENTIASLKSSQKELQSAKVVLEDSLTSARQLFERKEKEVIERLAELTAAHKVELEKLHIQMRSHSGSGEISQDVNQVQKQVNTEVQELTEKHKVAIDGLEKDKMMLQKRISHLEEQLKMSSSKQDSGAVVEDVVKKIMNVMFHLLRSEFVPGTSYEGGSIRQILLATIKDVTLQYLNKITSEIQPTRVRGIPGGQEPQKGKETKSATPDRSFERKQLKPQENKEATPDRAFEQKQPLAEEASDKSVPQMLLQVEETNTQHQELQTDESKIKPSSSVPPIEQCPPSSHDTSRISGEVQTSEPQKTLLSTPATESGISQSRDSSLERGWRPQPPPSPLFDDEDDDDDWLS